MMDATFRSTALLCALLIGLAGFPAIAQDTPDTTEIRGMMKRNFEQPGNPLWVDPVIVEGTVAVASWAQGELGGRALLHRGPNGWSITLCAGDALRRADTLRDFGLTDREATALASRLAAAEQKIDPSCAAMFARFDGIVRMDAGTAGSHGHPAPHGKN